MQNIFQTSQFYIILIALLLPEYIYRSFKTLRARKDDNYQENNQEKLKERHSSITLQGKKEKSKRIKFEFWVHLLFCRL